MKRREGNMRAEKGNPFNVFQSYSKIHFCVNIFSEHNQRNYLEISKFQSTGNQPLSIGKVLNRKIFITLPICFAPFHVLAILYVGFLAFHFYFSSPAQRGGCVEGNLINQVHRSRQCQKQHNPLNIYATKRNSYQPPFPLSFAVAAIRFISWKRILKSVHLM